MNTNLETKDTLNTKVVANFSSLKLYLFFVPLFFLVVIVGFLYNHNAISISHYIAVQKDLFYQINAEYSQFPMAIYNLTQIGDAVIFLSLLSIFLMHAPKLWEALLSASLVSAVFSNILKALFSVPRPAASFDNTTFTIIGPTLTGHNSLPSGHAITFFTALTVLLFALMPKKTFSKIAWTVFIICIGLLLVFTRVGLGAHYPLDVITGSCIGAISGLAGIFINRKYKILSLIANKKYFPVFILLFLVCGGIIINKIIVENLIIFYFAVISLIVSLYQLTYAYLKK
ncbi:MAG: phosphatase PAP2 family protein [Flavobacterium sp.]